MKLLLTSAGITNKSIGKALFDLVGKPPEEITICYIPTASNVEKGDKEWQIRDIINIYKLGFKEIYITDISAVSKEIWLPQFEASDVLLFEGGNTFHLMRSMNKSGLSDILPELLKTKVYVGISAGSMVTNKDLTLSISQIIYGEDLQEKENLKGLNLVDFYFLPHLNSKYFDKVRANTIAKITEGMQEKIYALDDKSALKIVNGKVEVISEGKWR